MYDLYKPLRNKLREHDVWSGLAAVYHFMQLLQFKRPLPPALRFPELAWKSPYDLGIFEWEMLNLGRELILNSGPTGRSMMNWDAVAGGINLIKRIENQQWGRDAGEDDIFYELVRIANRQFDWQGGLNTALVSRFFMIIDDPRVRPQVIDEFGMTPTELYQITLSLAGHFLGRPTLDLPVQNQVNAVAPQATARLLDRLSLTLPEHREKTRALTSYDLNWAYNPSSLVEFPFVRLPRSVLCPAPALFLERMTKGIYFDLVRRGADFANSYGFAFEDYVAKVVRAADPPGRLNLEGSRKYGPSNARKDSVDWLVWDDEAVLFVECKAGRVKLGGKIDLADRLVMESEMGKLAAFIGQTYQTLSHALDGQYGFWEPAGRKIYPMIVTLDNWQRFGFLITDLLANLVTENLRARGVDPALVEAHPYTVCAIEDFEQAIQIISRRGVETVMARKIDGEQRLWDLKAVLLNFFQDDSASVRPLFGWDFAPGGGPRRRT